VAPAAAVEEPASTPGVALHLEIRGAIGPATKDYVIRGLERASDSGMRLVIIEMDTPGGLDAAMRDINKAILASTVPVATFVAPKGSRAASAGTYILYASHVAAMSPATNLGAATPVQIGGGTEPDEASGDEQDGSKDGDKKARQSGGAMERKAVNDAVAYIRGLADLRGRNADWAEKAVREAVSLTAEQAAKQKVIDFVVADVPALLEAAHGRTVRLQDREIKLATRGLMVDSYEPDWRTRLLAAITDPNIAYVLFLIGIYGLIFEGYNPGAVLPGVVGGICLLLALFAFQVLSVNYAGLALMLLGVTLLVAEAFVPSFGTLGIGGIIAFVFGSILLLDSDIPGFAISRNIIAGLGLAASLALLAMMTLLVRSRRRPVVSGRESMIGESAEAMEDFDGEGAVFVHGERWNARSRRPVRKGDRLRVVSMSGLILDVEPDERPR
jgi:membrane-bound serine protease (ClpP class)